MAPIQTMIRKRYVFTFTKERVHEPVIHRLILEHGLMFNVIRASISPDEEGKMVLELIGQSRAIESGLALVRELGIGVESLNQDIRRTEEVCIHCGACAGYCPTQALYIERPSMEVRFDPERCIACERCLTACLTHAMEIHF